jgi:hypothetical protein
MLKEGRHRGKGGVERRKMFREGKRWRKRSVEGRGKRCEGRKMFV